MALTQKHLTVKGLRPSSVRSYRDTIRLLILFVAKEKRSRITKLTLGDLTFERIVGFLRHLEEDRGNHIRTRNQRLAVIHTLAVFTARGQPLTRYGIYKIVRRHAADLDDPRTGRRVSPHIFRHTAAVHLLEAEVEVNVIRGWLGHADLTTTNRYAEINTKARDPAPTQSGAPTKPC